ncbi:MAG: glucoamylase family protein [Fimbriimonadales bacterium]
MDTKTLLEQLAKRAFDFFWNETHPDSGLTKDRANNYERDSFHVSSIAASGFALASLPTAVERRWVSKANALKRAELIMEGHLQLEHQRGWLYHFIHWETGKREWQSEISSIDTGLFIIGGLVASEYFDDRALRRRVNQFFERMDFRWMLTDGGAKPNERTLSHGWKPETGFLGNRWNEYSEHNFLYLLALGSPSTPIPAECWDAWRRPIVRYKEYELLLGGPLFIHQMSHGYIDFKNQRDRLGYDYWVSSYNATRAQIAFCAEHAVRYRTYEGGVWGLTASDGPDGYRAYGAPGWVEHDGTVAPTASITSIIFTPEESVRAIKTIYDRYHSRLWGRYGFGNAFNVDRNWWDREVIGIDLGMMLNALENHRSGLIWSLTAKMPAIQRGLREAGFYRTREDPTRAPLRLVR